MSTTQEMEREFAEFERRIDRLKQAERELDTLGTPEWREQSHKEIAALRARLKDPKRVDEVEQELIALKEKLKPDVSVSLSRTSFELDTWSDVDLGLENTGSAPARNIAVTMPDIVEVSSLSNIRSLPSDRETKVSFRLKPLRKGKIPLKLAITFEDTGGKQYKAEQTVDIEVAGAKMESPVEPTFTATFPKELQTIYSSAESLARGGFARVFKARRKKDGAIAAVKVPLELDPVVGKSFLSEIENWKKLDHDNIVRLLDFNILPAIYIEMELCQQSLEELTKPLIVERAAYIILEVARGLGYAHSKGIIHRDLKPSNILLRDEIPKISDWGLSKVKAESRQSLSTSFSAMYAAPEQFSPRTFGRSDERTDIFQLGIIFYELTTGELPFKGEDLTEISYAITNETPKPPSEVNPEAVGVEPMIMRCLQKKKEDRYQSIAELQGDLASFLGVDFKKSLTLSRSHLEKIKLCTDLVEVFATQGNCQKSILYLKNLQNYISSDEIKGMVQEEVNALEFYSRQEVSMADRLPKLQEIIHRARMGG